MRDGPAVRRATTASAAARPGAVPTRAVGAARSGPPVGRVVVLASVLVPFLTSGLAAQEEPAPADPVGADLDTAGVRIDVPALLESTGASTLPELLEGRVPGLYVDPSSGQVGAAARIRLRGSSSLALRNTPLVYVDGVRVASRTDGGPFSDLSLGDGQPIGQTTSRLSDLDPVEIASIQVLKGPAASAVYGPDAASGVLLIETRRGGPGGPRITVSTEQGAARDVGEYRDNYLNVTAVSGITDPDDPRLDGWSPERNPVTGDLFVRDNPLEDPDRTPFGTGRSQAYHLSASGAVGDDAAGTYFGSVGYREEDGALPGNHHERFHGRVNLSVRPAPSLDVGAHVAHIDRGNDLPLSGGFILGILENGAVGSPLHEYGDAQGDGRGTCLATALRGDPATVCSDRRGYWRARPEDLSSFANGEDLRRTTWSASARWVPTGWLTGRLRGGEDRVKSALWEIQPPEQADVAFVPSGGHAVLGEISEDRRTLEAAVTVSGSLSDPIEMSTTLGIQRYDLHRDLAFCEGTNFPTDAVPEPGDDPAAACEPAPARTVGSSTSESDQTGGFVQGNLRYRDFLSVHGSLRADDHSAALEDDGLIWAPAGGASLLLHRLPGWGWEAADELRARLAWGRSSRVAEGGEDFLPIVLGPGPPSTTAPSAVETTEEVEAGLDAVLLDHRLSLSATYYRQQTSDAFLGIFVPVQGELENEGVEASLRARAVDGESVTWELGLTLATADPVVTDLGGAPPALYEPGRGYVLEGQAPGVKLAPVVGDAERDGGGEIVPGSVTLLPSDVGDPFVTETRFLGNPRPADEESLWTTVTLFGGLRVHAQFRRAAGHVNYDGTAAIGSVAPTSLTRRDAFRQAESTPEEQAALEAPRGVPMRDAAFVHDATFVKWRELTVSYRLPDGWRERVLPFAESVTLSASGRNLATWTDYPGLDPEARATGGREGFHQADQFTLPPVRSFHGRLSLTF